jgi:hypothetical protein
MKLTSVALFSLASVSTKGQEQEDPILALSEDSSMSFQLLAGLAQVPYGGGDINQFLGAAKHIEPGNFTSWYNALFAVAEEAKKQAMDPDSAYDPINVRDTWFATANLYRQADFYNHDVWDDPRINSLWDEQRAAFDKGLAALPIPGQRVQIPTENFTIEAIWYAASEETTKRPTMVVGNGYDASQEDSYHTIVVPALARGWNVITYEGPGQPTVRRNDNIGFIPDWERVVTPVVDWLFCRKAALIEEERLVLFGYSMGGYLAARAAAFEPRFTALVVDGGVWDIYEAYASQLTPEMRAMLDAGEKEAFDQIALELLHDPNTPTTIRWGMGQGLWSFKIESPFDWLQRCKEFSMKSFVDRIKVPVLVIEAEIETFFRGQAETVKDALGDKASLYVFRGLAGYHCQLGALQELNRVMFAWLHKTLG